MATTRSNTTSEQSAATRAAAGAGLTVTVHHPRTGMVLVRVHGEIDLATAPQLREVLDEAFAAPADPGRSTRVVCDLSGVDFLGAAGADTLLHAAETATGHGRELHLIANTRRVRRVLTLCEVDRQLPVTSELAEVLDAGTNRPGTP